MNHYRLTKVTIFMMAVACGLAVGSNYLIQPLIADISEYFSLSVEKSGYFVTLSQITYALGLIFIIPLADLIDNRKLLACLFGLIAISMFLTAFSPHFSILIIGLTGLGLFCVAAQVIVPLAATLATPENRSKTVGNVMSGLLSGILLARTISGTIAAYLDWRSVYAIIGIVVCVMGILLYQKLPTIPIKEQNSYPQILLSVWKLQAQNTLLRNRSILGAMNFALFSMLWTSLTLLLASSPYSYSVGTIGAFGLLGACGVLGANIVGHLAKRSRWALITLFGVFIHVISWGFLYLGSQHLWALLIGILILDFAASAIHICNQTIIYRDESSPRGRITAGYMTLYFMGGVIGSLISAQAYANAGWTRVCLYAAILATIMTIYAILTRQLTEKTT